MQAIVRTGGKQYRVKEGDVIQVEKIEGEIGSEVILDDILMVKSDAGDGEVMIGSPNLADFTIKGEIRDQGRGKKIVVFTYKRRKGFKKKQGHRQPYTGILVKEIMGAAKVDDKVKESKEKEKE
ncbi:50S ribosomal protein L21 [Candidatus Sumerlaeota bacterium]|nr:50S ribosomal protein L21 [Candidatus Sumerlaeota bacterium]